MPRMKMATEQKRVLVFGRVDPGTVKFLQTLGEPNSGRAIDRTVKLAKAMMVAQQSMNEPTPATS